MQKRQSSKDEIIDDLLSVAKQARVCVGFMIMTATAETNRVNGKKFLEEIEAAIAKATAA